MIAMVRLAVGRGASFSKYGAEIGDLKTSRIPVDTLRVELPFGRDE